jgi:hypothetical protein
MSCQVLVVREVVKERNRNMNAVRLIKKETLAKQSPKPSAAQAPSLQRAVGVVKDWVKEHHATKAEHSRQLFAALFAHPQS